jgi:hypothetical protein
MSKLSTSIARVLFVLRLCIVSVLSLHFLCIVGIRVRPYLQLLSYSKG